MKTCITCKETKGYSYFYKDKSRKDGHCPSCKVCKRVAMKAWREDNKEAVAAYKKADREKHKVKRALSQKAWREANRERCAATAKAWREANKERKAATDKAWSEANKEKCASFGCVYAALKRTSLPPEVLFGSKSRVEANAFTLPFVQERLRIEEETGIPHHIDHIKPLCEGGLHVPSNLQVIPAKDNLIKGPIWFEEDLTDEEIEAADEEALSFNTVSQPYQFYPPSD